MLYYRSIDPGTYSLLKFLMEFPPLSGFNLVGGTALALQKGHRVSVDLDLFGQPFDKQAILKNLNEPFSIKSEADYFLMLVLRDVKVDILKYDVPLLFPLILEEGIRMYDPRDISAMKLLAISKRGKKRDFYD